MKKLLALAVVFCLVSGCANATRVIKYSNTGAPINNPNNFGQNAEFTPRNVEKRIERERRWKHEDQYYNGLEKGHTTNINVYTNSSDKKVKRDRTKRTYLKDRLKNKEQEENK